MPRSITAVVMIAIMTSLVICSAVSAAEVTRAQYVELSEPICKANTIKNRSILKGVHLNVRAGKLKRVGGKFRRAARALHQTIQRLEEIPRPSDDESLLARWFTHLNDEAGLLKKVAGRLLKGSRIGLGRYVIELKHTANVANNVVLTFGFEYCLIQTARYI